MGFDRITETVSALQAAGLHAQRGYPADPMPELVQTAVAVNVEQISASQTKLAVQVCSGVDGPSCEDTAETVVTVLSQLGAQCIVEGCRWDSRASVFVCVVKAVWDAMVNCTVKVGNATVLYARCVTAKKHISRVQVTDPETGEQKEECRNMGWSITVEELLPREHMPETDTTNEFTMYIQRPGGTERYEKCQWIQITLENVPEGVRRVRVARTWENRGLLNL